jgi:acetyltransferase-like isoleucine patch superfamily enzyme
MRVVLLGAGGHAKCVCAALWSAGHRVAGYVDPRQSAWLQAPQLDEHAVEPGEAVAIGIGGVTPEQLERRLAVALAYLARGCTAPTVLHARAVVDEAAQIGPASQAIAGAVVNPGAVIGTGCIINSGAIVEHDARIGDGAHVAPGAIVLGAAQIGRCAMIGAGAVVLPGAVVAGGTLVPALTRVAA